MGPPSCVSLYSDCAHLSLKAASFSRAGSSLTVSVASPPRLTQSELPTGSVVLVERVELLLGRVQSYRLCNPSASLRTSSPRALSVLVERVELLPGRVQSYRLCSPSTSLSASSPRAPSCWWKGWCSLSWGGDAGGISRMCCKTAVQPPSRLLSVWRGRHYWRWRPGFARVWQEVTVLLLFSRMSTASTMARHTGRRWGRAGAQPAASCPSRCAWSPGSPTTTPSRTVSPGESAPWAAGLLGSHAPRTPLVVRSPGTPGAEISALISNAEDDDWMLVFILWFDFSFNFSLLTHLKFCKDFEVDNHIKDFAAKLSLIPSPPPGPLHLVMKSELSCCCCFFFFSLQIVKVRWWRWFIYF